MMEKRYEEYAYVLDFLPHGRPGIRVSGKAGYRAGALVQLVGEEFFTLLEALAKGVKDPQVLAELAKGRLRSQRLDLEEALRGLPR